MLTSNVLANVPKTAHPRPWMWWLAAAGRDRAASILGVADSDVYESDCSDDLFSDFEGCL